jgi:hypothetical protein
MIVNWKIYITTRDPTHKYEFLLFCAVHFKSCIILARSPFALGLQPSREAAAMVTVSGAREKPAAAVLAS